MKAADDWIQDIIDTTVKNRGDRTIVLWGKYGVSDEIRKRLKKEHGIRDVIFVDSSQNRQDGYKVFSPEILHGRSANYYVVVPLASYDSIHQTLIRGGYKPKADYYYFCDCRVTETDDYYEDAHGNCVIGRRKGLKFAFSGWNAKIVIGDKVRFSETTIYMHTNSEVSIGKKGNYDNLEIDMEQHAKMCIGSKTYISNAYLGLGKCAFANIGRKCRFGNNGFINLGKKAKLDIGQNTSVGPSYCLTIGTRTRLIIGQDCMFSREVYLRSYDGHSIFDVRTGSNINSTKEILKQREIRIGDHVWVGMRATILYHTDIGDGSIVGASSLVKDKFPNNCILAGVPARVVRKDICWSRANGAAELYDDEKKYAALTGDHDIR